MAKYTYEQTKKALECCKHKTPECNKCPIRQAGCAMLIASLALDLINRQEAEIKRLKEKNRLANQCTPKAIRRARAEVIKEFAQRLKAEVLKNTVGNDSFAYLIFGYIDNLVKEMIGESNG